MTKQEAIALIDNHKNALIDPAEMLRWTWLRVIVNQLTEAEWDWLVENAHPTLRAWNRYRSRNRRTRRTTRPGPTNPGQREQNPK